MEIPLAIGLVAVSLFSCLFIGFRLADRDEPRRPTINLKAKAKAAVNAAVNAADVATVTGLGAMLRSARAYARRIEDAADKK